MKIPVSLFFLFLLAWGCKPASTQQEATSHADSATRPAQDLGLAPLVAYPAYLAQLDTLQPASATRAVQQFNQLFSGKEGAQADSGYALFAEFHHQLSLQLDQKPDAFPKDTLATHGFRIRQVEGSPMVVTDLTPLTRWVYPVVSPSMKEYLTQTTKEDREGFADDGGLVIEHPKFAERLVWWEKFVPAHTHFIWADKSRARQQYYRTYLFGGMPNTPLYTNESKHQLSDYYTHLYEFLMSKYPDSETTRLAKPFYFAIQMHEFKKAEDLLKQYRQQGLLPGQQPIP